MLLLFIETTRLQTIFSDLKVIQSAFAQVKLIVSIILILISYYRHYINLKMDVLPGGTAPVPLFLSSGGIGQPGPQLPHLP